MSCTVRPIPADLRVDEQTFLTGLNLVFKQLYNLKGHYRQEIM